MALSILLSSAVSVLTARDYVAGNAPAGRTDPSAGLRIDPRSIGATTRSRLEIPLR